LKWFEVGRQMCKNPGMTALLEIEVKFFLQDRESMRRKITGIGATGGGEIYEFNARYDDAADSLEHGSSLLRLRRDERVTLTYKHRPAETDDQFKIHGELEVELNNFDVMADILHALGFHRRQVYEKRRETFRLQGAVLCLDQMPFGDFLEIEGPKSDIRSIAERLELDWRRRILATYLDIFADIQNQLGLPFTDITFENFKEVPLNPESFMQRFAAG
jgi:adenylate cyclase class 2